MTWVRIREIAFPVEAADRVVEHVRDTMVARFGGEGYQGARLLLDREGGTALEVSYWQDEPSAAAAGVDGADVDPTGVPGGAVLRTRCYELAVDAG